MVDNVKGLRDFIGKEAVMRQETLNDIKEIFNEFGYEPIETPALEYLSIFINKAGPEVEEQLYSLEDKKGEKLALRPEHTISKMRVISGNKSLVFPLKTYSVGAVWRYEDPRKGRWREFIQADIDVVGSSNLRYDAEVIACLDAALKKIGMGNYIIKISSRKILQSILDELDTSPDASVQVFREVDKKDKIGIDEVTNRVSELIGGEKADKIRAYLSEEIVPDNEGYNETKKIMEYLNNEFGIKNVKFDISLVRGQDYYDGMIFEIASMDDAYKGLVFAGGGRYDRLSKKFESNFPIVGGSLGFDVIMEILKAKTPVEDFEEKYCVINIDSMQKATEIARRLREKGVKTDLLFEDVSLSKGLNYCNSKKIRYAVIVGKKDLEQGVITIRDLKEKADKKVKESEL